MRFPWALLAWGAGPRQGQTWPNALLSWANGDVRRAAARRGEGTPEALEAKLEAAIQTRFGFPVAVVVRTSAQWRAYAAANPFPDQGAADPSKLMMTIGKRPATDTDAAALRPRASDGERVECAGGAIWLWLPNGAGRSRLAAAPPGKDVWTARNWRTILAIQEMLCSPSH